MAAALLTPAFLVPRKNGTCPRVTDMLAPQEELKGIWTPHEPRHFASQLGRLHSEASTKVG